MHTGFTNSNSNTLLNQHLRASDPILALFANGEQGGVFRAWKLSESAGDTLGTWPDTDGQTNDQLTAANGAESPLVQVDGSGHKYVKFDAIDDLMQSAAGVLSGALDELWIVAAVESRDDTVRNTVCGISDEAYSSSNQWCVLDLEVSGETRFAVSEGTGAPKTASVASVAGSPALLHGIYTQAAVILRSNGSQVASTSHTIGQVTVDEELDVGAIDSAGSAILHSPVNVYGLLIRDKAPTAEEIAIVDAEFAANCPVTLP